MKPGFNFFAVGGFDFGFNVRLSSLAKVARPVISGELIEAVTFEMLWWCKSKRYGAFDCLWYGIVGYSWYLWSRESPENRSRCNMETQERKQISNIHSIRRQVRQ